VIALVTSIQPLPQAEAEPQSAPQSATSAEQAPAANPRIFGDPFFGRIIDGALDYLAPRRLYLLLMHATCESARYEVLDSLRQGVADGALVVSTDSNDPLPALLADAGLPAVFFARPGPSVPVDYVDLAHQDGGRLVADRLVEQGRRRVAVIAGPLNLHASQARIGGFCDAMARHGVAYVPVVHGNFTQDSGEQAMRELLLRIPDVDGVFAANDLMAVGAIHVLRESGRRIPEDVAVIGFDDSSAALAARPQLTTVRQPVEAMAASMSRLLLERLDSPRRQPQAKLFDPELIVRSSG
jgi:DNA-binding LacI/PurR family transcriptional regulator